MVLGVPTSEFSTDSISHLYHWDEIKGWQLLVQHFELHEQGFAFIIVCAPDDWAIALIREHFKLTLASSDQIQRIRFDPLAGPDSLAESLLHFDFPPTGLRVIWIDADPASPEQLDQRDEDWNHALSRLNRYRNTLQAKLKCTVVLAVPSRTEHILRSAAPDIWSIRSALLRIEPTGTSHAGFCHLPTEDSLSLERTETSIVGDPATTLTEADKLRGKPGRELLLAALLQRAGNQSRSRLDWDSAIKHLQEAYSLLTTFGGDVGLQWDIAIDLGNVLYDVARYDRAEHYFQKAVQISDEHFGSNDSRTALSLNNLALLLKTTNRLSEAERLMRRALEIAEAAYGLENPNFARVLSNWAQLLKETNRLSEAESLMHRCLGIDEKTYGTNHPSVARDFNNLAQSLVATNRLAEAEEYMKRALAIDEAFFGPNHPNIARDLNNLAQLQQSTGRLNEAESLMRRALVIDESTYGATHPHVAEDLNNLAQLLHSTNRLEESEILTRRALSIDETCFGTNHPNVARDFNNLALLFQSTNRLAEAESLLRQALHMDEASYGPNHPNVAIVLSNLASLLLATNRHVEAEPYLIRSLEILREFHASTGFEHPNAHIHFENYRLLLRQMNLSKRETDKRLAPYLPENSTANSTRK